MAPRRLALDQLVEPDAEHSGNQLEQAEASPVAVVAKVGGERLGALPGRASAPIELVPERRREAFFRVAARHVAGEGLAIEDRGQHASLGPVALEFLDLGVGPARFRGGRRAQYDQILRSRERQADFLRRDHRRRRAHGGRGRSESAASGRRHSRSACRQANAAHEIARAPGAASRPAPGPYGCSSGRRNSGPGRGQCDGRRRQRRSGAPS